ncbi:amino acid adenylation domain-containing protein [Pseudomonas sp. GD04087]|uniref:non-ribosomal peptide synthetase n=1 Tax=unclassified Pseudomonas TaxID=196821 RepID=UPI002446E7D6|nr:MULTISPECIES: non-ribosomal peptide synthetase [unclassified Pseudomonas]MDH0288165.1 amino acid adenylation domain-containing protein [Pseudomonas sp. GD04087]MDH1049012.1 amino acid adenylation domain-containing protein [Pseudomonas sp. GD03903]MDH1999551.1 amino acid adenylation domain-containing protein [Pseudomonas sp. GD03691]
MSGGMNHPMDAQLKQVAERLGALSEDKQIIFLRQLREKGVSLSRLPILREGREHAPLSAAQARLWFLWQMEPHSAAYNIPAAVRLRGALDEGALQRAFTALIARHESLRTVFRNVEDRSGRANDAQRHPPQPGPGATADNADALCALRGPDGQVPPTVEGRSGRANDAQRHPPQPGPGATADNAGALCALRESDGEVMQCILPPVPAHLERKDFANEAEARQWLNQCAQRSFDLAEGPLLRLHLARLPGEALLLVNLHHIIADGWSIGVLIDDFSELYKAEVNGTQAELEALPIQYSDIARWQRLWLAAGEGERQLAYWQEQLGDESPLLTLPGDRPRPLVQSYRGATLEFELPRALSDSLRELARGQGATLFMLILAAYQLLLSRYSGQRELRIGVPIAGRGRAESDRLIGFFVNTQVLSGRIDGDESFNAFLARTREAVLGAQANPDLPFEQLVDALQPERSLSYNPLFQVACNHQPSRRDALRELPGGLQLESLELDSGIAKFDLTLNTEESRDGQVRGQFMYATDQFDAATIERLAGHFLNLLRGIVAEPHCPVARLPLLEGSEREQLLYGWNATGMDYPRNACLHELIEQQVARTPNDIALTDGQRSLDYAELNSRANRLAHWLREQGVGPDSRVGVALERSVELPVALLAVLKAGGAYVPLDPEFPAERLAHMLEDGGVRLLLTQQHLLGELPQTGARAFCLDRDWAQLEAYADSDLANLARPDDLAYVIYTSGSTGKPKGVAVRHGGVVNFMLSMAREPGLDARDRVLALTSLSFDISALELYLPLLVGGRVVLVDRDVARAPARLLGVALEQGVTVIQATPSTWTLLSGHEEFPRLTGCRFFCGGEALSAELADKLTARFDKESGDALWNLYGPTETTIWSAAWKIDKGARALLGKPIANTQLYILDGELQPSPIGVAGELYIAGDGLARGYHGRPELTAERFVADPYAGLYGQPGRRMYRTGDLARWRADGVLEYLGRIDHQVKIRGFRIELGEIESRLLGQPGVREAVVIARDAGQVKQLVGYVTGQIDSDLRAALLEELPDYMVPAQIVQLQRMPLTPNGKLDRKALPEPDFSLLQKSYRAPESEREQTLAAIWCAVLGLERVGLDDNFFELGGDSIVSIQVVSRARAAGLQLSPKDLFQHQTLQALARVAGDFAALEAPSVSSAAIDAPDAAQLAALGLNPDQIEDLYPLSPMQQGMLFHGVDGSEGGVYVNQLRVEVHGLDVERFRSAWQAALDAHDNLRAGVHWQGLDKPLQAVHKRVELPLEVLDWRGREDMDAALDELATAERSRSFDLERPPLLRLVLVRSAEDSHQLVYTHHHILLDGWSNAQLFAEALRRYNGESIAEQGRYRDYIHWLQAQDQQQAQDFWSARLQGFAQPTVLADSLARPAEGSGHGLEYSRYDAAATERLKAFARSQRVTLNTLVQAAWILLLQRYTGQQRVAFGATVAGRPAQLAGADSLLGLFINTLPIVQAPAEHADLGDWLRELQAYNLDVREFEHTPLYDIQRWAGQAGQALFDSIIVFENYPVDEVLRSARGPRFGELKSKDETSIPMDLAVRVGDRLEIEYQYLRAHFSAPAVARLRGNLEQVLDSLLHGAGKRVGELQCLSANDRAALAACRGPQQSLPPAEPVHLAIARQAALRGADVALICGDEEIDYAALERDSNRLAHRLMALGVGPEVRVGVALPRSVRIPLALLAVLKAGGAYVPLDAEYPRERLEFQMSDAGIALLITDSRLRERLPLPAGVACLELDGLDLSGEDSNLPVVGLEPENLAYLIYTSGSTGKPKGVAVSHGPLAMHCAAIGELYRMDAATCELHFMSFAFDGAHERWLTTLVHGGSLVLRGDELWTPEQTYRVLHDKQVSVAAFPPVYLQQLAEHALRDGNPPPVRIYCFGGDAVPNASFELAKRALRAEHLINGYGPTETVVTPLLWKADRATACDAAYAPIGKGVGARTLYILDEQLRQVPLGVAGELYIGGDGLARGYHERAGLTAERFVADPFDLSQEHGGRLYRSGDLVRGRADGVIDYVGRIDHQVKIRGFRIELGEIEARLQDHPQVSEALVVARDGISGKQLVGYVVGEADGDTLRSFLREQVPDYMVPAQILQLARFPLSPNGKIDRKALPEPTWQGEAYEAPRNEREQALADIWQDVLQVERVGIRDNFFDLGGDSILSLQIVSRARQALGEGVEIRLRDLLQYQTIAGLLERAESVAEAVPVNTVEVVDDGESFGLVPIQHWMFEQQLEEPNHFNQAVLLECRQRLDADALEAALQGLLAEHGSLRLSFARGTDGQWRQRYREASEITGALLWQRQAANSEEALLIANQAQRSLDLSEGRLLRGVLTDMADGTQRLLLVIHHLGVDGVSWRILLEELQQRYAAQVSGEPAPRFERTSAYRAWAEGLREYADSQLAQGDLPYWLEQTESAGLGQPQRDNPRGTERMAQLEQTFLRLDREQTQRLLKVAPEAYRTQINDLLLTALGRTLCQWCESESVLIGLEGHGREDILDSVDHSRTLGWFTSLFPLRLTPGQGGYAHAIPAIRQQLRAVPDKGIGYGALRYLGDSALRRQLAARAEPRVTFNYLGQFDQSFDDQALFVPLQEKPGDTYAASTPMNNWLEIVGQVYDGELTLRCMFSRRVFRPSRIEALMAQLREELVGVIGHCCAQVETAKEKATV